MADKGINTDKICEYLGHWLDLPTKRQDEVIQKARNYKGSEKEESSL